MHVADGGGEDVDSGSVNVLFCLFGRGEAASQVGGFVVNFGARPDVADLAFDEDGGVDRFEGFDSLFGLADVFFEGECGEIEDDGVEAGLGCFDGFGQGVSVVCVEEDGEASFFAETSDQSTDRTCSHELAFSL